MQHRLLTRLRRAAPGIVLGMAAGLATLPMLGYRPPADNYFEIAKNIDIFGRVMREVSTNYVDEVEVNRFTRFGLDAMLKTLDPYTDFISAAQVEEYRFLSTGQYGGIGISAAIRGAEVVVTEIVEDSPAHKQGLRIGDRILQIDREPLRGPNLNEQRLALLLSGQAKSQVTLRVRRLGQAEPLILSFTRQDVDVPSVEYYGLVDGDVGYITLSAFTRDATQAVRRAMDALRAQNPQLKGYVLDLRENPGGLLSEAIGVSNLFVAKGERIVETRGRMEGQVSVYEADRAPADLETPLVVLVNEHSASASEIVAGVVQDYDRGVVVGRTSYGKGLVQTTRPLSYNAQIKLTTARYYTPSGRCIQAVDYTHNDAAGGVLRKADSLKVTYRTRRGRPVKDAGGIDPDVPVPAPQLQPVTQQLQAQGLLSDFATLYAQKLTPQTVDPKTYRLPQDAFASLQTYLQQAGFAYESPTAKQLEALRAQAANEGLAPALKAQLDALSNTVAAQAAKALDNSRTEIEELLRREVVERLHLRRGKREAAFTTDPDVRAAVAVLHDAPRYQALLRPKQ